MEKEGASVANERPVMRLCSHIIIIAVTISEYRRFSECLRSAC